MRKRARSAGPGQEAARRLLSLIVWLTMLMVIPELGQAQTVEDNQLRLNQSGQRRSASRDRALLEDTDTLTVDGRDYSVAHTVSEIGQAIYIALGRQQWPDVQRFLRRYASMPGADPMLLHYARGGLARHKGHLRQAEREYRALLALQPDFLPGQLELARVLFENQRDQAAATQFRQIAAALPSTAKADGIRHTVQLFLQALRRRHSWQGSFALGPGYNDNINQAQASQTCLWIDGAGNCIIHRRMPAAIAATGLDIEASLFRQQPLSGPHNIYLRSLLMGSLYPGHTRYHQLNSLNQIGYQYRSGHDTWMLAPSFDTGSYGSGLLYRAWGLHGEWSHGFASSWLLKLEADHKRFRYPMFGYRDFDGHLEDGFVTVSRAVGQHWLLLGGLDLVDKQARDPAQGFMQRGARLGAVYSLENQFSLYLMASVRERDYAAFNPMLAQRRHDLERNLILIASLPRWSLFGIYPSLVAQISEIRSNVDWLYSYQRRQISLRLQRPF